MKEENYTFKTVNDGQGFIDKYIGIAYKEIEEKNLYLLRQAYKKVLEESGMYIKYEIIEIIKKINMHILLTYGEVGGMSL